MIIKLTCKTDQSTYELTLNKIKSLHIHLYIYIYIYIYMCVCVFISIHYKAYTLNAIPRHY